MIALLAWGDLRALAIGLLVAVLGIVLTLAFERRPTKRPRRAAICPDCKTVHRADDGATTEETS